ncbi:hypothetical protein [Actinoallomurus sp. NPDC050550]|uniref:hypothetical protein n=1 Tax=Actinoallomurus sp. NPDC050550 TaxID=3154937 RepID=UPI0033CE1A38
MPTSSPTSPRRALLATVAACLALGVLSAPAHAAPTAPSETGAQRVVKELADQGISPASQPGTSKTPLRAQAQTAGSKVTITLDGARSHQTTVGGGLAVTPNALAHVDAAVLTGPGNFTDFAILRDAKAAKSLSFAVDSKGGRLVADSLGGVIVVGKDGKAIGRISAPWAIDAHGRELPTTYTVQGDKLIQQVDTRGAAFPVVADPHYTWGWITGTIYFNRNETQLIASSSDWARKFGGFLPSPWSTIVVLYAEYLHIAAQHANSVGVCVKLKSTGTAGLYGGSEGDGYCH